MDEICEGDEGTVSQYPDGTGWQVTGVVERITGETLHVRTDAGELIQCGHPYFQVAGEEE